LPAPAPKHSLFYAACVVYTEFGIDPDCHIHATLRQRLNAVHKLRFQHSIKTLCRVLRVNRSTYYKHFRSEPAPRTLENQRLKSMILQIYAASGKRLGAYKIAAVLKRDYGIKISVGRVYRLMRSMVLPRMSTQKPRIAVLLIISPATTG